MTEEAPYSVRRVAAPPEILAQMRGAAAQAKAGRGHALLRGLLAIAPVLLIVYGAIGLLDLAFGIIGPAHWFVLVLGSAILLLPMLLMQSREARDAEAAMASEAGAQRRAADTGQVLRHDLRRDGRHWFVAHEHGVMMVCPAGKGRTLFLDLSSVADDSRFEEWYAPGRIHAACWTWFTAPDGRAPLGFATSGEVLPPSAFEAAAGRYDPEDGVALFEFLGSPGDGDVLRRPFAKVDAFLRARIAPG